jgi:hypothetical protein
LGVKLKHSVIYPLRACFDKENRGIALVLCSYLLGWKLLAVHVFSISNRKQFNFSLGGINNVKYAAVSNPNSGTFPAMKVFRVARKGILF